MPRRPRFSAVFAGTLLAGLATLATANEDTLFPRYPSLAPVVAFWTGVFGRQSENTTVVHVASTPQIVLAQLDFTPDLPPDVRRAQERSAVAQMQRSLNELHAAIIAKESLGAEEQALLSRFGTLATADTIKAAASDLRTQRGVRERTARAMAISGQLLPMMESTFARHDLPVSLTRLPFIESSFDFEAYSKVGAAGLWQFMPSTAKHYMRLDDTVDDRRDPWVATDGAARHLADDYALLKDWPLAITAYNHGRNGIRRGLEKTGSTNLVELIATNDHPRFGFASKNFYAEFLAAKDIEAGAATFFPEVDRDAPIAFVEVTLAHYVPYADLINLGGDDPALFQQLNPGYSNEVRSGRLWVPRGAVVRIPGSSPDRFNSAYANLPESALNDRQRVYWREYRVRRGDVLGKIAVQHGVTSQLIQQANKLPNANRLKIGQRLKIPPAAAGVAQVATKPAPRLHIVKSGQTLSGIARLHGVSINQIAKTNRLANADALRTGQRLRIPQG